MGHWTCPFENECSKSYRGFVLIGIFLILQEILVLAKNMLGYTVSSTEKECKGVHSRHGRSSMG
jgi:hypothetical protein